MKLAQLASDRNLNLAWRRITTGGNQQYKRFFRELYYAYEIALNNNLADLRQRLLGGTFKPEPPERVYLPKSSGLHRPLSLLHLEDQIVLQAFANLAAKKLHKQRAPLQFKSVFSNILQKQDSIFFFKRWQQTYAAFERKILHHFTTGQRWMVDFDLAAFYDTVSHKLLLKTIYPRTSENDDIKWLLNCLGTWSSDDPSSAHGHGLPQGPLASDFLAESFLLPVDLKLAKINGYTRYVDDIRFFGATENEVRQAVIELERQCRERGLIPQSGKFEIKKSQSVREALAILPSLGDPQQTSSRRKLSASRAYSLFQGALEGKPRRIKDKTRVRYILYRARPEGRLLTLVLRLVPRHPEHADAFFSFITSCDFRRSILRLCLSLIKDSPYPYLRGEAWHVVARCLNNSHALTGIQRQDLTTKAIEIAKRKRSENFLERWGACHYLAAFENLTGSRHSRFLRYQSPLTQALLAPILPPGAFSQAGAAEQYLRRSSIEPGLSICGRLHALNIRPIAMGVKESELHSQVKNTLCELGMLQTQKTQVDPIAEVLNRRYGVLSSTSWHKLLGSEYAHALGLLKQAEATFFSGPSFWLATQNGFNQIVFLSLQAHLGSIGAPGIVKTKDKHGKLLDYGVTLDATNQFSKKYPLIADCFRQMNSRRNNLPLAHPYEKKRAGRNLYLRAQERNRFVSQLRKAYSDCIPIMPQ